MFLLNMPSWKLKRGSSIDVALWWITRLFLFAVDDIIIINHCSPKNDFAKPKNVQTFETFLEIKLHRNVHLFCLS